MDLATLGFFLQTAGSNDNMDWPEAFIAASAVLGGIIMITAIGTTIIWQGLGTWRARMVISREAAYQRLAEDMATTNRDTLTELRRVSAELSVMSARTAEMERLLKEVE